jgi:hypothetical protein
MMVQYLVGMAELLQALLNGCVVLLSLIGSSIKPPQFLL